LTNIFCMKLRFLILFTLIPLIVTAQNNYMSLCFGGIKPLGSFTASDNLQKDGFSLNGFAGEYSGGWLLRNHLGLGANIRYASNPIDEDRLSELLLNEIPSFFADTLSPAIGITYWRQVSITTGPYITFGRGLFNFDLFVLGGINFVMPPKMNTNIESGTNSFSSKLESRTLSYALDMGMAFRLHLNDKTSLRLYCCYFQSHARGTTKQMLQIDREISTANIQYKCPIQTLNTGIGIAYRL
jgi:hypothetical protein